MNSSGSVGWSPFRLTVWTGPSDTVNPQSPNKAIDALSKLIVQELQKQNII